MKGFKNQKEIDRYLQSKIFVREITRDVIAMASEMELVNKHFPSFNIDKESYQGSHCNIEISKEWVFIEIEKMYLGGGGEMYTFSYPSYLLIEDADIKSWIQSELDIKKEEEKKKEEIKKIEIENRRKNKENMEKNKLKSLMKKYPDIT